MTRLLKFSQFPDYYCEEPIIGDFHVFRKIPPWTELVLMPQTSYEEAHALVAWFPPNAFVDITVLDQFGWEEAPATGRSSRSFLFLSAM